MTHDQELQFSRSLTALLPHTKGYARTLVGRSYNSLYEDFAQTAILKAWQHRDRFVPGTNLKAWLFTILRNTVVSHHRRHGREVVTANPGDQHLRDDSANPEAAVAARQSLERMQRLTRPHHEVLIDIGWAGLSYRQSAKRHGVPLGTIRSRVARAREVLTELTIGDELRYGRRIPKHTNPLGASP